MSTYIVVECDFPDCREKRLDGKSAEPSVARTRAREGGWRTKVQKSAEMPAWVPDYFDLCPVHKEMIP